MSLDSFKEYGALILLFRSCEDESVKDQVLKLIPELAAWDTDDAERMRWIMHAVDSEGEKLATKAITCPESELPKHERNFQNQFDLSQGVTISIRKVADA